MYTREKTFDMRGRGEEEALKECFLPFPVSLRNLDFAFVV